MGVRGWACGSRAGIKRERRSGATAGAVFFRSGLSAFAWPLSHSFYLYRLTMPRCCSPAGTSSACTRASAMALAPRPAAAGPRRRAFAGLPPPHAATPFAAAPRSSPSLLRPRAVRKTFTSFDDMIKEVSERAGGAPSVPPHRERERKRETQALQPLRPSPSLSTSRPFLSSSTSTPPGAGPAGS